MSCVQTVVPTFVATIYVGFKETTTGSIQGIGLAESVIQDMANKGGLCVTITPTRYIYKNGNEPGCAIGLINYPRFPEQPEQIREKAVRIAEALKQVYKQQKVSIVFPDETVMLTSQQS